MLKKLIDNLPPWIRIVATSRPNKEKDIISKNIRFNKLLPTEEENKNDIQQYTSHRVYSIINSWTKSNLPYTILSTDKPLDVIKSFLTSSESKTVNTLLPYNILIQKIANKSKGNFLYARYVLDDIEKLERKEDDIAVSMKYLEAIIEKLPEGLKEKDGYYSWRFEKEMGGIEKFTEGENCSIYNVLLLLLRSREALSKKQIQMILGIQNSKREQHALDRIIDKDIGTFLSMSEDTIKINNTTNSESKEEEIKVVKYQFYHLSFSDWL